MWLSLFGQEVLWLGQAKYTLSIRSQKIEPNLSASADRELFRFSIVNLFLSPKEQANKQSGKCNFSPTPVCFLYSGSFSFYFILLLLFFSIKLLGCPNWGLSSGSLPWAADCWMFVEFFEVVVDGFRSFHVLVTTFISQIKYFTPWSLSRWNLHFDTSKQWLILLLYLYCLLKGVREKLEIRRSEIWRHRKMAVVFETLFELAKPNGYPNFHGRRFSMGPFL